MEHVLAVLKWLVVKVIERLLILLILCRFLGLFLALEEVWGHRLGPTHFLLLRFFVDILHFVELVQHSIVDYPCWQLHTLRVLVGRSVVQFKHLLIYIVSRVLVFTHLKRVRLLKLSTYSPSFLLISLEHDGGGVIDFVAVRLVIFLDWIELRSRLLSRFSCQGRLWWLRRYVKA